MAIFQGLKSRLPEFSKLASDQSHRLTATTESLPAHGSSSYVLSKSETYNHPY